MNTVGEITHDLPKLDTGIYWYPIYPDHVATINNYKTKEILRRIPIYPPGSDYYSARDKGRIPDRFKKEEYDLKRVKHNGGEKYKFCQRIERDNVFSTICTSMSKFFYITFGLIKFCC